MFNINNVKIVLTNIFNKIYKNNNNIITQK